MLFTKLCVVAALVTPSFAHPWMKDEAAVQDRLEKKGGCPFGFDKMMKKSAIPDDTVEVRDGDDHEKRILGLGETVDNLLGGVGDLLDGLLGSLPSLVNGETRVPDAAHPFQAPGPTDQRGPCPGLNTLANHGCTCLTTRLSRPPTNLFARHLKVRYRHGG